MGVGGGGHTDDLLLLVWSCNLWFLRGSWVGLGPGPATPVVSGYASSF